LKKTAVVIIVLSLFTVGAFINWYLHTDFTYTDKSELYDGQNVYGYYNYTGNTTSCHRCDGTGTYEHIEWFYFGDRLTNRVVTETCDVCDGRGYRREIVYTEVFGNSYRKVGTISWEDWDNL